MEKVENDSRPTSDLRWYSRAACRTAADPDEFFTATGRHVRTLINRYCAACPVTAECLATAMANESMRHRFGVYGGMTPDERDRYALRHGLTKRAGRESARVSAERKLRLVPTTAEAVDA